MKNTIDMRPSDLTLTRQILSKHLPSNATVWVFGSRAKGGARIFSDLDLMIDNNHQPLPLTILTQLLDEFEESDLPYKVDVLDWNGIGDDFRTMVYHERIPLSLLPNAKQLSDD